jgi:hypothetical protein
MRGTGVEEARVEALEELLSEGERRRTGAGHR